MGSKQERNPSAVRMDQLLHLLEQEGKMTTGEIAARLHVSIVTASHDAEALLASGLAVLGREYACGRKHDRKLRLRDDWCFLLLLVSAQGLKSLAYCPATGAYTRRGISLCDAIPLEESMLAAWRGALASEKASTAGACGVILDDGADLPDAVVHELTALPSATRAALIDEAILRRYPDKNVLYLRYGETPTMRMFSHGLPISALRSHDELCRAWGTNPRERLSQMAKQLMRVLSFLTVDTVLLESDGADVVAVQKGLEEALVREGEGYPPIVVVDAPSLCECEMLARLHMLVAEQVVTAAKATKKSPIEP